VTFAAIIGGGISGLALAHGLRARGKEVVVLEASPRPGGTIHTFREQGFIAEAGPNGFLDKEPATGRLVAALGLSGKVKVAEPANKLRFIWLGGRLQPVPTSPPGFLRSQLLPFSAKLRAAGEVFVGRSDQGGDESLASFARRRFGPAILPLVDAVQTGIYAGDVEKLSLLATFPRLAALELEHRSIILGASRERRQRADRPTFSASAPPPGPAQLCTFEGGLSTLVEALAASLGPALRTSAQVQGLSREGASWRVQLEGGAVEAEKVVLAVPSHAAAPLIRPLDAELAEQVASIQHSRMAVLHLGFPKRALPVVPEGFGFLAPRAEGRRVLGCIYVSSIFPWRAPEGEALLTLMVGGATRPELMDLDDAALVALGREELQAALGIRAEPSYVRLQRWERGIPQYNVGHLARLDRILRRAAALPGFHLAGNSFRGIGMNDCIRTAAELTAELCWTPSTAAQRPQVKIAKTR
jgi:oxygen-dependent protoporphyrinogen oxidase